MTKAYYSGSRIGGRMSRGNYSALFQDRNFLRFWASTLSADLGYGLFELAITWLVITTSHSAAVTGGVLFVEFSTYSLTAVVGPLIDSASNKKLFITKVFPIQAGIAVIVTVLIIFRAVTVPLILLIAFLMAFLWDFPWLAQSAMLPLILKRQKLLQANSLMQAFGGGSTIFINALAGIVIAIVGVQGVSTIYAITFLASAAIMRTVNVPHTEKRSLSAGALSSSLIEGWRYVMRGARKDLRELFFVSGLQGFFSVAPILLITVISFTYLHDDVTEYGILNALLLAGGFAGNFVFGKLNPTPRIGRVMLLTTFVEGFLIALSQLAVHSIVLTDMIWFLVGSFDPIFYNGYNSYIQSTVDHDHMARVKGNAYLLRGMGRGGGNLALGILILYSGLAAGAEIFGFALALLAAFLLLARSEISKMGYV
ncbi:MAG: MFS transporter [Candidatus Thermoplasmatota archaeon]|nr:MFS transporter [Candidatus Thermoplasmatota archaeon]